MVTKQIGIVVAAIVLIIIVVLALVAVVSWYRNTVPQDSGSILMSVMSKRSRQPKTPPVTDQPGQNTIAAANSAADWQTYRNDNCGYEIKYPAEYSHVENNGKESFVTTDTVKCYEQGGAAQTMCDKTNGGPNINCYLAKDFLNGGF